MLKAQDIVILLKLLAHPENAKWTQRDLAKQLGISLSEVCMGLKRLLNANLLREDFSSDRIVPNKSAAEEFLVSGLKYIFPVKLGGVNRGIPTSFACSVFKDLLTIGNDPIPIWPSALGKDRGVSLEPLYASVPDSLHNYPDKKFYELLAMVDVIRHAGARERNIASKLLKERIQYGK